MDSHHLPRPSLSLPGLQALQSPLEPFLQTEGWLVVGQAHSWCHYQWPVTSLGQCLSHATCEFFNNLQPGHPVPVIYSHLVCLFRQEHSGPFLCCMWCTILDLPASKAVWEYDLPKIFLGRNRDKGVMQPSFAFSPVLSTLTNQV